MTTTETINLLKLMIEPGQERNNKALNIAVEALKEKTGKAISVCRVCGRKIDSGRIEIVPERAMIVRHLTKGEQVQIDERLYGKDPDKYVKKRDVIKLIRQANSKKGMIEDIRAM